MSDLKKVYLESNKMITAKLMMVVNSECKQSDKTDKCELRGNVLILSWVVSS